MQSEIKVCMYVDIVIVCLNSRTSISTLHNTCKFLVYDYSYNHVLSNVGYFK